MRTLDESALARIENLLGSAHLARPRMRRDRYGRFHRDSAAEWDWYYELSPTERRWIDTHATSSTGTLRPDVAATNAGYGSVDEWAAALIDAMRHARNRDAWNRDVLADDEPEPDPEDDELLGPAEVADLLHVTRAAIRKMRERGQLPTPAFELSGLPVWYFGDVRSWAIRTGREVIEAVA